MKHHKIVLYHYLNSVGSMQARLALAEKRVSWKSELINTIRSEHLSPGYVRLNPNGALPTLVHNGLVVAEPLTVLHYIDEELPGPSLSPSDPDQRACMEKWLEVQDIFPLQELCFGTLEGLDAHVAGRVMDERMELASKLADLYPDLRASYTQKLDDMEEFVEIYRDPRRVATLVKNLAVTLQLMEFELQGRMWLTGDKYTLADVAWTAIFHRLEARGFAHFWNHGSSPRVAELYNRYRMRSSYHASITMYWNPEVKASLTRLAQRRPRVANALLTVSCME